jgi:hypothetical protein
MYYEYISRRILAPHAASNVTDRIDFQIISLDGVYLEISSTEHRMRSKFVNVDFRYGLGRSIASPYGFFFKPNQTTSLQGGFLTALHN